MAEVQTQVSSFMGYEHRDKDGNLIAIGENRILRHGKVEFTHKNAAGIKLYQSLQALSDGRMLEEKFYDEKGKETEKLVYAYTAKMELLSVTDKAGVVSLSPDMVETELLVK